MHHNSATVALFITLLYVTACSTSATVALHHDLHPSSHAHVAALDIQGLHKG
jgi:hypothetical protein